MRQTFQLFCGLTESFGQKAFEVCKSNLRVGPDGQHPLDKAMLSLYNTAEVVFHLLPTPGSAPAKRARSPDAEPAKPAAAAPKASPKANPKRKTKPDRVKVPEALKGFPGLNKHKARVCYNFNLPHGCSNSTHEKDGRLRCVKGNHECIKCGGGHGLQACNKK